MLRWRSGADPITGKSRQQQETFHGGKKAAQQRLGEHVSRTKRGTEATLGALIDAWLPVAPLADSTRESYGYALAHLPERLRATPLTKITPPTIVALHRHLLDAGVGAQTIRKLHTTLSSAFQWALAGGWVDRNPCRGISPPSVDPAPPVIMTIEQLCAIQADADGRPGAWGALVLLLKGTGARIGEIMALRWCDVDLLAGVAHITSSMRRNMSRGKPKSVAGVRDVELDDDTVDGLAAWYQRAVARAAAVGVDLAPDAFIVSDLADSSRPWRTALGTNRMKRLTAVHGCAGATPHDFRHTHLTMLIEAGITVRTAADRAGHTNPAFTQQTYGHAIEGAGRQAANTFGQLMKGKKVRAPRRG